MYLFSLKLIFGVCLWVGFFEFGFFFLEGLVHSNWSRICPHNAFTVIHVFLVTFIKLLLELAGKLLEKPLSLV